MKIIKNLSVLSLILILILSAYSTIQAPAADSMEEDNEVMEESMEETTVPEAMPDTGNDDSMDEVMPEEESMEDEEMMDDDIMQDDSMKDEMPESEEEMADDALTEDDMDDDMLEEPEMMDQPAFFNAALSDVRTGESFSLNDFAGKVILVETMAVWCPSCLRQQMEVKQLQAALGDRDDFLTVILDIDPNEDADDLKSYVEENAFQGYYAVAPAEVSSEIGNLYGSQFLNPPSTPIFIIDRHGEVHLLPFGIKDAEVLEEAVGMYLQVGLESEGDY